MGYGAPSGSLGALKETVLARNAPFGGPRGPRRAPRDQIWSQLPPIGPPWLDTWSPHTLTWYRGQLGPNLVPRGPPRTSGAPKRGISGKTVPFTFWPFRAPKRPRGRSS